MGLQAQSKDSPLLLWWGPAAFQQHVPLLICSQETMHNAPSLDAFAAQAPNPDTPRNFWDRCENFCNCCSLYSSILTLIHPNYEEHSGTVISRGFALHWLPTQAGVKFRHQRLSPHLGNNTSFPSLFFWLRHWGFPQLLELRPQLISLRHRQGVLRVP